MQHAVYSQMPNLRSKATVYQDQINLLHELDIEAKDESDRNELEYVLKKLLAYPSKEKAKLHQQCNKLGSLDLNEEHQDKLTLSDLAELGVGLKFCQCCGFIRQESDIKLCDPIHEVTNIGLSTFLYFRTLIVLSILLSIMFVIYCLFAIVTNLIASSQYQTSSKMDSKIVTNHGILALSLGSKQLNATEQNITLYSIQAWFGVAMVVLWLGYFIFTKGQEKKAEFRVRNQSYSAADFSIMMENVPKHFTDQHIQREFTRYAHTTGVNSFAPLNIAKLNMGRPFYLDQNQLKSDDIDDLNLLHREKIQEISEWVMERRSQNYFSVPQERRQNAYYELLDLKKKRVDAYKTISQKILREFEESGQCPTYTAFITFETNKQKDIFVDMNRNNLTDKIRNVLWCFRNSSRFNLTDNTGSVSEVTISEAPEPEDIIWTNLGRSKGERIKRKIQTYMITILLLCVSFGVVYGLSVLNLNLQESNRGLSLFISVVISGFNLGIQFIIKELTQYERDFTQTNHQATLGFKSVFALLINSILIPILVNYLVEGNLYGQNGLAYDIFYLGITNAFLSPLLKIFDIYYLFTRIMAWYKNKPANRLGLSQDQLNKYNEYLFFQVGYEYIYAVNLFLFTCFFASLQPIIVVFSILGILLMHWAQKHSIYTRCKRPVPGGTTINNTMYQLIYLGGIFFTLGNLSWSSFFPQGMVNRGLVPNLICLALSLILFLFPYDFFFSQMYEEDADDKKRNFEDYRVFLPSEYDRLNPATSEQAIKQFLEYIKIYRQNVERRSDQSQMNRMEQIFLRQMGRGRQTNPILPLFGGLANNQQKDSYNVIQQIFSSQSQIINPLLLGASILENKQNRQMGLWSKLLGQGNNQIPIQNLLAQKVQKQLVRDNFVESLQPHNNNIFNMQNQFSKIFHMTDSKAINQSRMPGSIKRGYY